MPIPLPKCSLCKSKPADETGSHMVPHFLLKRIENIEGKTGRDYEIGFQIGDLYTQSHFGRSVSPETLENAFGEISDEDIERNTHPFVEDHVFCRECEKRLAELESKYSKSISIYGDEDSSYSSGVDYQVGLLFWLSLVWRLSISQATNSFLLTKGQAELARRVLARHLQDESKSIFNYDDSSRLNYKLVRASSPPNGFGTALVPYPHTRSPYVIIVDEFILCFSFSKKFRIGPDQDEFCIAQFLRNTPLNKKGDKEMLFAIPNGSLGSVYLRINQFKAKRQVQRWSSVLDKFWKGHKPRHQEMPPEIKDRIIKSLVDSDLSIGRKYTQGAFFDAIREAYLYFGILKMD